MDYPTGITISGYEPSPLETVRLLFLCWTADHPGRCETGKFLNQGRCGCRRCKIVGQHLENSSNTHYYYGQNRFHYRHPRGPRTIESELANIFDMKAGQVLEKKNVFRERFYWPVHFSLIPLSSLWI